MEGMTETEESINHHYYKTYIRYTNQKFKFRNGQQPVNIYSKISNAEL